jgi:hypothetical protein
MTNADDLLLTFFGASQEICEKLNGFHIFVLFFKTNETNSLVSHFFNTLFHFVDTDSVGKSRPSALNQSQHKGLFEKKKHFLWNENLFS